MAESNGGKMMGKWFKAGTKVPAGSRKAGEKTGRMM